MVEGFHNVLFPATIAIGSRGGPMRRTEITSLSSGQERRVARWSNSRRRFDAGFGIRKQSDIDAVIAFFEAREGRRFTFRWRDPFDHMSSLGATDVMPTDQNLGTGDGVTKTFPLVKTYESGTYQQKRTILLPVLETVRVAIDGTEMDSSGYAISPIDGVVSFTAPPASGQNISAGFLFDIPARFDTDTLVLSAQLGGSTVPNIPIVEVLG